MNKISFYTFSEDISPGVIRAIKNVYQYVDDIVIRVGKKENLDILSKIDPSNKVRVFQKKFTTFADVRNFCLSKTLFDWVLTLDDDETFSSIFLSSLAELKKDRKVFGYKINRIHFYHTKKEVFDPFKHLRFFKKNKGVRYLGRVHELLDGIEKNRVKEISNINMTIFHFNKYKDMVLKNKKYLAILQDELAIAEKTKDSRLINLAEFRIWSNQNIDNVGNFYKLEKMKTIRKEFDARLEQVLGKDKNYHKRLMKLESIYLKSK